MANRLFTPMAVSTAAPATARPPAPPPPAGDRTGLELSTGARTLGEMVLKAGTHAGVALRYKEGERWLEITYPELVRRARGIAKGLIALGIEPGDRISILSDTRPEWTVADAGAFCAAATIAPIYQTNSPEECAYILKHSEARAIFCENAEQLAKIDQIRDECPALEHVIAFAGEGAGSISLDQLAELGLSVPDEDVDARVAAIDPGSIASLVYTSGTTGPPKGCILTHDNFMAATHALEERLDLTRTNAPIEFFLFLPLAHVFGRIVEVFTLDLGGTIIYWQRDATRLLDDLREARPTYFPSVPRVWEKIYTAATTGIAEQPKLKRTIFGWALGVGHEAFDFQRRQETPGAVLKAKYRLADHLVLHKVRDLFGGRLERAFTAAAPIAPEVLDFFHSSGIMLAEAWGMTETCAAGSINTEVEMKIGTVGRPVPTLELKVAEDGELLARGTNIFRGYFKDEAATDDTLHDGWLATGDLGTIDENGYVRITGRKKDIIITSSGKNITPANLENALRQTRWIADAVAFGDRRPYLVALLTLDPEEAPKLAQQLGIPADTASMVKDPRVLNEIQKSVDAVNQRFARIEQIKRFTILDRQLSQDDGELTPTLKVKRNVVYEKFAEIFDGLYAG